MTVLEAREALAVRLEKLREAGEIERVVLANGCFDLLHVGHLRYLEDSKSRGDYLVVALNTDASVRQNKGEGRPLVPLEERAELIAGFSCVDAVFGFDEPTMEESLRALRPDVHSKGTDYTVDSVPERHVDLELGIEIVICGDPKDHSTTELAERMSS